MSKLIQRLINSPCEANIERLRLYLRKHPMATCMATTAELAIIRAAGLGDL